MSKFFSTGPSRKIREAVRYTTDRTENGGILKPEDDAGKGKSVKEVLMEQYPDQSISIHFMQQTAHVEKSCSFLT